MNEIQPFWHRIPAFFGYGFHWRVLLLAVTLALLNAYLLPGLFVVVLYAATTRYAMAVLDATARGELTPPALDRTTLGSGYELPIKLFLILLLYGLALTWVAVSVGEVAAITLYLAGSLLFPALVMTLVLTESLVAALNPLGWVGLARAIGWPYLALFGIWMAVGAAQENASIFMVDWVPERWVLPFWLAFNTVFSVIAFHMMGYVLLQYHAEIGDPLSTGRRLAEAAPQTGLRTRLFDQLLAEGNLAAASAELLDQVKRHPGDLDMRRQAHNFLLSHHQLEPLKRNAQVLLDEQLAAGQIAPAAETFSDCFGRDVVCRPRNPALYVALIRQLRAMGKAAAAVGLGNGFHKRFPTTDDVVPVYLEIAAALSEDLNRDDKAIQLLDFVIGRFGGHRRIGEAHELRKVLTRLDGQPA